MIIRQKGCLLPGSKATFWLRNTLYNHVIVKSIGAVSKSHVAEPSVFEIKDVAEVIKFLLLIAKLKGKSNNEERAEN